MSVSKQLERDIEKATLGLKAMNTMAHAVWDRGEHLRKDSEELEMVLRELLANDIVARSREAREPLAKILERLQRHRELRNIMELGAFEIEVGKAFEKAWRALP